MQLIPVDFSQTHGLNAGFRSIHIAFRILSQLFSLTWRNFWPGALDSGDRLRAERDVFMNKIVYKYMKELEPRARPGRPAKVTACPYCGQQMNQSSHAKHRPGCKAEFQNAPPQASEFAQDPGGGYNKDGTFPQT